LLERRSPSNHIQTNLFKLFSCQVAVTVTVTATADIG
jgi:hypothetical protein